MKTHNLPAMRLVASSVALVLGGLVLSSNAALAKPAIPKISGDFRLRSEVDWDSVTAAGMPRKDRARSRLRARLAVSESLAKGLTLNLRVRTGGKGSQQNANVTFGDYSGNRPEPLGVSLDRFEISWTGKHAVVSAGRMAFPFFTQNEFFWDADINPLGLAGSVTLPLGGKRTLKATVGQFTLPVGLADYSGGLTAGQVTYSDSHATLAAGLFHMQPSRSDPDRLNLLDGNGQRAYTVLAVNGRYARKIDKVTLTVGADFFRNLTSYSDPADPIGLANTKRRTGYVLSVMLLRRTISSSATAISTSNGWR